MKKINLNKPNLLILIIIFILSSCNSKIQENTIMVDTGKTGEPIEEYIYGQFIEHLGKCIYGGIWAEMLDDRKFYYPVIADFDPWAQDSDRFWNTGPYTYLNGSPWEIIGEEDAVKMDTKNPFSGEQSVQVIVPGDGSNAGIKQARLAVVANKKYTGSLILSGNIGVLPVTVQLLNHTGEKISVEITEITKEYKSYPFEFTPGFSCNEATLEILSTGKGQFKIGTVSLMPSDNIKGWRKDVIALLKELNSPIYRWPGGNFVSGYNWMDGIGERDKRPPRKNPAWKGVEANDVGIHEYMELMEIIDSEPFIAVNTGLGTVEEVAREIEYCNSTANTDMGKLRAENGHPEPYGIKWWAVGNEMFGNWQLGHMPLKDYVKKHNLMAKAIWDVDPNAKLIGVGAIGDWSETMMEQCSDYMDFISEHIYCRELDDVTNHIAQLENSIKNVADAHRQYRESIPGLAEKNIRIAMDEWNYWYGDYIYGELGVRYHQKDALGVAKGLHEYFRNSDIYFMANYAQTVNVIGCIKTTPTTAGFATTGLPLKLYRNEFGTIPVIIENSIEGLDISVALTEEKNQLTIAVINSTPEFASLPFEFENTKITKMGKQWIIQHNDPQVYNEPGKDPKVVIAESKLDFKNKTLEIPGYSILMVNLEIN
ncbi:MAG: alpha-N-arabinofuranosidase [Mariniphaga sp.]|nr:alpha-N-arabinofuranosidase [Mariniphaga sp.]